MLFDDFLAMATNSEVTDRVIADGNPWGHPNGVVEVGGINASRRQLILAAVGVCERLRATP
jgi:hypothetical protein